MKNAFTLIELLVTLAIMGILTAIAYPMYTNHVVRTNRASAEAILLSVSASMERFYSQNNTFVGATLAGLSQPTGTDNGSYTIAIASQSATAFSITATPNGAQSTNDPGCATLSYNQLGQKGITGTGTVADCWR